jgi:hypothetical protein
MPYGSSCSAVRLFSRLSNSPSVCLSVCPSDYITVSLFVSPSIYSSISITLCWWVCLSIHLSDYLHFCPSVCLLFICPSTCLSFYLSIYLSVCLSVCPSDYITVSFLVSTSIYSPISITLCRCVYLSIHLSDCLHFCPSVCLLFIYPSTCLSLLLSVHLPVCF